MQATFIGNGEDDDAQVFIFGEVFLKGQPKDVSHVSDAIKAKISSHPHFSVSEGAPRRKPRKANAEPQGDDE